MGNLLDLSFESTIYLNTTILGVDKLNYLSFLLEGPALAAVAGLIITTVNYMKPLTHRKQVNILISKNQALQILQDV